MTQKTVLILPGCTDTSAVKMFESRGWKAILYNSIWSVEEYFVVLRHNLLTRNGMSLRFPSSICSRTLRYISSVSAVEHNS
jgi:hypothetical protein